MLFEATVVFFTEGPVMSRIDTPVSNPTPSSVRISHEKIAMRAYEKWVKRGRQHGGHEQDWMEAEAELKAELARGTGSSTSTYSPPRR